MPEVEYVTKEVFDMQVKSLRERDDLIDRLSDARSDRLEAFMEKTIAEIKMDNSQLRSELKSEVRAMNERIEKNLAEYKAIASEMQGNFRADVVRLEGRIETVNAKIDTLQNKFSWSIAWMGIIIGVVLAVIQHFWK